MFRKTWSKFFRIHFEIHSQQGSSYYQPNKCTVQGKYLKHSIHLHCLIPPKLVIQWSLHKWQCLQNSIHFRNLSGYAQCHCSTSPQTKLKDPPKMDICSTLIVGVCCRFPWVLSGQKCNQPYHSRPILCYLMIFPTTWKQNQGIV